MQSHGLEDRLRADLTEAMRAKKELETSTLRMTLAALHARSIEKKGKGEAAALTDEETLAVLQKEVKKRREAADAFAAGGRSALAEKERSEAAFLETYLPARATDEAIREAVRAAVAAEGAKGFGAVMRAALATLKGSADGALVAAEAKRQLAERTS